LRCPRFKFSKISVNTSFVCDILHWTQEMTGGAVWSALWHCNYIEVSTFTWIHGAGRLLCSRGYRSRFHSRRREAAVSHTRYQC
jgi:hypothetical protein